MLLRRVFLLVVLGAWLTACGSSDGQQGNDQVEPDVGVDVPGDVVTPDTHDVSPLDLPDAIIDLGGGDPGPDAGDDAVESVDTPDVGPDLPPGCADDPGLPYCPCSSDGQCLSGTCIFTPAGKVCAEACSDDCPTGWACRDISDTDPIVVCVPAQPTLCHPCTTDADCASAGFEAGLLKCLDYGADVGRFCGGPCGAGYGDCPAGYTCDPTAGVPQCKATGGECTCSAWARQVGLSTACSRTNEAGTCTGQRTCGAAGLSPCSASTPSNEHCDTVDNDCDGAIDEVVDLGMSNCGTGPCYHSVPACVDGALNECNPWQGAQPEACNGQDDDCDTQTDETFIDTDGDATADCVDADDDNDGVPDDGNGSGNPSDKPCTGGSVDVCDDNCPLEKNAAQADLDADGKGDACDPDKDGDGSADVALGGTDCNDQDAQVNVGKSEGEAYGLGLCNGVDDDCDGETDEGYGDLDSDGSPDCRDPDDDNDGSLDTVDCKPLDATVSPLETEACNGRDDDCDGQTDEGFPDTDGDGTKDCVENDLDGDGDADLSDCKPNDPTVFHGQNEACNGQDDNCNVIADEGFADFDDDGHADCVDPDDDDDGALDAADCKPFDAAIAPGKPELCNGVDDNCAGGADEGFVDTDDDGQPDCLDVDDDEDGIVDTKDNCPLAPNFDQQDLDDDDQGDVCDLDDDGDGVPDVNDNCPLLANPDVGDNDLDGQGDACDPDDDNDTKADGADNCPLAANADQKDFDADQMGDACDPDRDGDGVLNAADTCPFIDDKIDSNGNGIPEKCEIQWAGLAWPNGWDPATANNTFDMYLQVYKPGSTTLAEWKNKPAPDIDVHVRYKKEGDATWQQAVAAYNVDQGNNKEYKYIIPAAFVTPGGSLVVEWLPYDVTGGVGYEHLYTAGVADKASPAHWQPFTYPIQ